MCYNLNKNTYSIISNLQYNQINYKKENPYQIPFIYMLEYKQIPSLQIWGQTNYLNESTPLGYNFIAMATNGCISMDYH